jgi:antirestriction protein ArdC
MIKIDQPIVGFSVVTEETKKPEPTLVERPEELSGTTYKLKTPLSENALYITINGRDGRPFEIFINSKSMQHYQWIVALTRVMSAVFRHGGDSSFLIDELKSIQNPSGGYFKGGKYVASLVAEIGDILEHHFIGLGLYQKDESLADAARAMVAEKTMINTEEMRGIQCQKCHEFTVIVLDGCYTCTSCGDSKCN